MINGILSAIIELVLRMTLFFYVIKRLIGFQIQPVGRGLEIPVLELKLPPNFDKHTISQ